MGIDQLQPGVPAATLVQPRSDHAAGGIDPRAWRAAADSGAPGCRQENTKSSLGERRWRAAQEAQLAEVPVLVQGFSDAEALEIGLIENVQRAGSECAGRSRCLSAPDGRIRPHTAGAGGTTIGKSRSHIANTLRLLTLPDSDQDDGDHRAADAPPCTCIAERTERGARLRKTIITRDLSVRDTEKLVAASATKNAGKPKPASRSADVALIENDLAQRLGLKVKIASEGKAGSVTLFFQRP